MHVSTKDSFRSRILLVVQLRQFFVKSRQLKSTQAFHISQKYEWKYNVCDSTMKLK